MHDDNWVLGKAFELCDTQSCHGVMYVVINPRVMTELRPGFVDGEMLHTRLLKEI